ncbi:MAG: hypothetical protein AABO57_08860 [Acidobacteriota bacterium]
MNKRVLAYIRVARFGVHGLLLTSLFLQCGDGVTPITLIIQRCLNDKSKGKPMSIPTPGEPCSKRPLAVTPQLSSGWFAEEPL